jgi:hypothetical protein
VRRVLHWSIAIVSNACWLLASALTAPAWACGCGAYIPDRPGATVAGERALIAWDGARQDIVMSFDVTGQSDTAAWIMPVPSVAQVEFGDPALFDDLERLTAPRVEYRDNWWPSFEWLESSGGDLETAAARPGSGVDVLGRQRIGPFDVTRLRADDPAGLARWLSDNGFPFTDGLADNLAAYVEDRWEVVAITLAPTDAARTLTGELQPLALSFASNSVVYPMRLSRSAQAPQTVDLYVLSKHRMDPSAVPVAGNEPALEFAGPLETSRLRWNRIGPEADT